MKNSFAKNWKKIGIVINDLVDKAQGFYRGSFEDIRKLEDKLVKSQKDEEDSKEVHLSWVDPWKFWLVGAACAFIAVAVFESLDLIYLIITSFIIAMAIENVILFFQRRCSRGFSMTISYLLLVIFVLSGLIIVVPFVVSQMIELLNVLIEQVSQRQELLQSQGIGKSIENSSLPNQIKQRLLGMVEEQGRGVAVQTALIDNLDQIITFGTSSIKDAGSTAVNIITGFFSVAFQSAIVFFMSIFFSLEKKNVIRFIAHISGHTTRTELVLMKLYRKLGFWLEGQIVLCLAVGILVAIGLIVLSRFGIDLPNKTTLAIIAGLTEFIPYLGPLLGMIPALLIGLTQYGLTGFVSVFGLYRLIQQAENNVLVPMVMYHTLGASPLLIFICMLIGGSLFGFLGVLLAVPIAVITSILYDTYKKPDHKSVVE